MKISEAEIFLAYRQAKQSLYLEDPSVGVLEMAEAELTLPETVRSLKRHLGQRKWFSGLNIGKVWLVPKRADVAKARTGVTRIGSEHAARISRLTVRPYFVPSAEFVIVEILWIWKFGAALESLLDVHARGNRLKLTRHRTDVDMESRGCFEFWPAAYQSFRDRGFAVARRLLKGKSAACLLATFDLSNFYDEVDPEFLLSPEFIREVQAGCKYLEIRFNANEYLRATKTLVGAYRRFYRSCKSLTGIEVTRGIPVGGLTSKVVANLALSTLDDHVSSQRGIKYYARYVDDILLVAAATSKTTLTARGIARKFLPLDAASRKARRNIALDSSRLRRLGSKFLLHDGKLRGYLLQGNRGGHFLNVIERDIRRIASERRAFLSPDGLGTESSFSALILGSDGDAPIQVLREVDRLKAERYAASITISKVAVGVELLDQDERAAWSHQMLHALVETLTAPEHWLEFIDLSFRALRVALRANDVSTGSLILLRQSQRWQALASQLPDMEFLWNGSAVSAQGAARHLSDWLERRVVEAVCASIPFPTLRSRKSVGAFVNAIAGGRLRMKGSRLRSSTIRTLAKSLAIADLRAAGWESDRTGSDWLKSVLIRPDQWRKFQETLGTAERLSALWAGSERFLDVCQKIGDSVYSGSSVVDIVLMTRPPSVFDIASRWSRSSSPADTLYATVNAIRGTKYSEDSVRESSKGVIDVTAGPVFELGSVKDPIVILGNMRLEKDWLRAALENRPVMSRPRVSALARVVKEAIDLRHRSGKEVILILPELSLPQLWLKPLADRLITEGVSVVAGLEYRAVHGGYVNEAAGVFAIGFHATAVVHWQKSVPAHAEEQLFATFRRHFRKNRKASPIINTDAGSISTLICSELLDVRRRADLLGRVDLLVVPAWNKDTATFDHTIQTVANDLHCFVAVANNAEYSDCRLQQPSDERYLRDACRLISRDGGNSVSVEIGVAALRNFQQDSLREPTSKHAGFKPIPPGYKFRR